MVSGVNFPCLDCILGVVTVELTKISKDGHCLAEMLAVMNQMRCLTELLYSSCLKFSSLLRVHSMILEFNLSVGQEETDGLSFAVIV